MPTLVECVCAHCNSPILKELKAYNRSINKRFFCGHTCVHLYNKKSVEVACRECGTLFEKAASQIRKTKNNFCSQSCSSTFHVKHRKQGLKRSKFEYWVEMHLEKEFPDLEILYGRCDIVGMELDIYVPSLKLAFEINGLVHHKPIYGQEKFERIQKNDAAKLERCEEKGIELIVVDISNMRKFKSLILSDHTERIIGEIKKRLA